MVPESFLPAAPTLLKMNFFTGIFQGFFFSIFLAAVSVTVISYLVALF